MICIIQARASSRRLPNKVLIKIFGKTVLERVIKSVKRSKKITKIIVATSTDKKDNNIVKICNKLNISYFRGSLGNVAKRFSDLVMSMKCSSFIRISADSPLVDYKLINKCVLKFFTGKYDIVTNVHPRTFPKGQSIEIINTSIFAKELKNIIKFNKEHFTQIFYKKKKIKLYNIKNNKDLSGVNLCIDDKKDLVKVSKIIQKTKDKYCSFKKLSALYEKV